MATTSPVIWTLFVGPFTGACLAFALARVYDAHRRFRERLAAANLALLTIKNQRNDFLLFRRGFREDCSRPGVNDMTPHWALIRPSFMTYGGYDFDYAAIAFLFESGTDFAKTFEAIELAQIQHRDLKSIDEQRTETTQKAQQMVVDGAKEKEIGPDASIQEAADILGPARLAELDMLCLGLAVRAEDNDRAYVEAFNMLRAAFRDDIMNTYKYRAGYAYRLRHDATVEQLLIRLNDRLSPGFNADELSPLPSGLKARVEETLRNRTKAKAVPA
jgi:hypothetical protein